MSETEQQRKEREHQESGVHFEKNHRSYSFALKYGEQRARKKR